MHRFDDCELRPIRPGDKDILLAWRNSDHVRSNMYTDHLIAPEEHERWFASALQHPSAQFAVFALRGVPVGFSSLTGISREHQRCTWGFYLGEQGLPKGTGSALGYLALAHAFDTLGMYKLSSEAFAFNHASLALHRKLGFREEGRLVEHYLKRGQRQDIVCLAKFSNQWGSDRQALRDLCFSPEGV
ncbi:UDP-4-amino-4,6-dideoxy-N-acetyl-beta-L-altrosamine N-acetyltransferase [Cupriavidus basilensis]|uniref:UDP-4-amino-4, 6-dideoxy-N-acetyl-beta-L-altrosamine N-acetyltransferase n=1 Tax=Cupriavidus basilensis TaxID=68895 RepID=UPI00157B8C8F|nr:UDP-4-amino-4,6-dideoxy-N-acetyl-beta-L-altrosamine N-acetyltransferase [Cupriavidus basilensis]NUA25403.1 UDP-4-amino-4,6-dideoxy-N-acetyl-beta-L-altrosamine N-acetyltransferase [Cupriavidus basilensis]